MRRERDRLHPARVLRQARQQTAEEVAAGRRSRLEQAEAELVRAERALEEHGRARKQLATSSAMGADHRKAAELQREAVHASHLRERGKALERERQHAVERRDQRRSALEDARQQLQQAIAERKAVERHCSRIEADRKKAAELNDEMEAEDVQRARRPTPLPGTG